MSRSPTRSADARFIADTRYIAQCIRRALSIQGTGAPVAVEAERDSGDEAVEDFEDAAAVEILSLAVRLLRSANGRGREAIFSARVAIRRLRAHRRFGAKSDTRCSREQWTIGLESSYLGARSGALTVLAEGGGACGIADAHERRAQASGVREADLLKPVRR